MNETLKKAFSELDIDDKRNELNNEMELVYRVLNVIKQNIGLETIEGEGIRNYDIVRDANLSESEMLDLLYYDFYVIQKNVIDIADALIKNNN